VAFTVFPGEIFQAPRSWAEKVYPNLIYFNEADRGGHFAAWEEPELFSTEVRAAFRSSLIGAHTRVVTSMERSAAFRRRAPCPGGRAHAGTFSGPYRVLRAREAFVPFRVLLDGEAPGDAHGLDVDEEGHGTLVQPRLYQLIRQPGSVTDRSFEIAFDAPASRPTPSRSASDGQ
jgi:hypothetical protein